MICLEKEREGISGADGSVSPVNTSLLFQMRCHCCGYRYWVRVPREAAVPEYELCPLCGHGDEFRRFIWEVE